MRSILIVVIIIIINKQEVAKKVFLFALCVM